MSSTRRDGNKCCVKAIGRRTYSVRLFMSDLRRLLGEDCGREKGKSDSSCTRAAISCGLFLRWYYVY